MARLAHANTAPDMHAPDTTSNTASVPSVPSLPSVPETTASAKAEVPRPDAKSKEDKKREKKDREAAEKAAKVAEKERAKLEEKKKKDDVLRNMQARRNESDELQKVLEASKKSAAMEQESRKKDGDAPNPTPIGFLDRSKRGSRSVSRKGFGLFGKDKGTPPPPLPEEGQNGDAPEKQEKLMGRLSMGLGRKKSSHMLSS